jgi:F0F1-type ATP synthase assembly protein I
MSPTSDPSNQSPWQTAFGSKVMLVGGEVGCLTLLVVLGSVLGGLWLDNFLGTKPLFTIGLVLASAPLSIVVTIWIARRAVKDYTTQPPQTGAPATREKEGEDER